MTRKSVYILIAIPALCYTLMSSTGVDCKKISNQNDFFIRQVLAPASHLRNISSAQLLHMEALDFLLENNEKFLQEDRKNFEKWLNTKQGLDKKYLEIMNSIHKSLLQIPQMEVRKDTLYGIWSSLLSLSDRMDSSASHDLLLSAVSETVQEALKEYSPINIPSVAKAKDTENLLGEISTLPKTLSTLTHIEDLKNDAYFKFLVTLNNWEQLRKWINQGQLTDPEIIKNLDTRRKQIIDLLINEAEHEVAGKDIQNEGKAVSHRINTPGSAQPVQSDYDPTVQSLTPGILNNRSEVVVKKFYEKFNALMRQTAERGPYVFPDTCFDTNVYTDPILFNLEEFGSASNEVMTIETAMSFFAFLQNVGSTDSPAWKNLKESLTKSLKGKNDELLRTMNLMIGMGERRFNAFMDEISLRRPLNYPSLDKYQQKEVDKIIKNNLFLVELEKLSAMKDAIKSKEKDSSDPEVMKDLLMQSMIVKSFEDDAYLTPGAFIETVINGQMAGYDPKSLEYINLREKGMSYRQLCSMIENAAKMLKTKEKYAEDPHKSLANSAKYISRLLQIQYSMNAMNDETGNFMMDMHHKDKNIEDLVLLIKEHKGQNANIEHILLEKMQNKELDSKVIAAELLATCEKQFFEGFVSYAAQVNSEIRINKWKKWDAEIKVYKDKIDEKFEGPDLCNIFGKSLNAYETTDWVGVLMVIKNKLGNHYESIQKDIETDSNAGITIKNTFLSKSLQNKIANIPEMNNQQLTVVLKEIIDYLRLSKKDDQQALTQFNQTFPGLFQSAA